MRVKIVSDGRPHTTKVVDIETGRELDGVTRIEWRIGVGELATATITLVDVPVEVEGELREPTAWREFVRRVAWAVNELRWAFGGRARR